MAMTFRTLVCPCCGKGMLVTVHMEGDRVSYLSAAAPKEPWD